MLVLSRKADQKILINKDIEVRVLEIRGNSVKLGFVCPPEVAIHREEVYRRINETATEEGARPGPPSFDAADAWWAAAPVS